MRVLVTGGAGYIGSHTAKALRAAGLEPVVLDDLSMGHEWAVKWGPLVRGSIADTALVAKVIADHAIDAVVHFAAHAHLRESMVEPERFFRNNVAGSLSLLDACLASKRIQAFVFSSTCAVYGVPETTPITEDTPKKPINPYGESKLIIEQMLRWYGDIHGLRWSALRYFNACGADPDGEIGETHDPETHIIPLLIRAASGGPALNLFGVDHPTPDGTPIRDYIHVTDLADAHVRCLRYLLGGGASRAFNLGTGRGASIRDVIRSVTRIVGAPAIVEKPRNPGDPPVLVADATAGARVLEWTPRHSDLDTIVGTAAKWLAAKR